MAKEVFQVAGQLHWQGMVAYAALTTEYEVVYDKVKEMGCQSIDSTGGADNV